MMMEVMTVLAILGAVGNVVLCAVHHFSAAQGRYGHGFR